MTPEGNVSGCGCAANYTVNAWGQALTDANSHTMTYMCDLAGEQTEVDRQDGTRLLTGYDADGNVQSQTDGLSHATSYGYDALNRKTSMTDALSRATSYGYDAAGNLTSLTDARGQSNELRLRRRRPAGLAQLFGQPDAQRQLLLQRSWRAALAGRRQR